MRESHAVMEDGWRHVPDCRDACLPHREKDQSRGNLLAGHLPEALSLATERRLGLVRHALTLISVRPSAAAAPDVDPESGICGPFGPLDSFILIKSCLYQSCHNTSAPSPKITSTSTRNQGAPIVADMRSSMTDSNLMSPIMTEASSSGITASSTTSSNAAVDDDAEVNRKREKRKVNMAFRPILK